MFYSSSIRKTSHITAGFFSLILIVTIICTNSSTAASILRTLHFAFVSTLHSTGFLKPALLFFHSLAFWKRGSAQAQRIIKGLHHNAEAQSTPHNDAHLLLEDLIGRNSIIPTISSYRPWSFHSVKSHGICFPALISPSPYSKLVPWFKCRSSTMAGSLIN